ncbi:hypothetical protein [Nostoc sp. CMAA1605]|uniref:hypothetical protein n=1 Tax=Nostoc sp. CMAA1605 TaxID=2055159 RepID=UPI001F16BC41|nr:hypothetical protein [Nostoc sp. CMAA1605]MCF4970338.1 hypothetical protein [Nostoc sp. CMAA1605]
MNALRQNLLPILALTDTQTEQICQVNRDLSMERQHEEKVKQTGSRRKGGRGQASAVSVSRTGAGGSPETASCLAIQENCFLIFTPH